MSAKMKRMLQKAAAALKSNSGQGLVEYALILVLIALVVLVALGNVGKTANNKFNSINSALTNNP